MRLSDTGKMASAASRAVLKTKQKGEGKMLPVWKQTKWHTMRHWTLWTIMRQINLLTSLETDEMAYGEVLNTVNSHKTDKFATCVLIQGKWHSLCSSKWQGAVLKTESIWLPAWIQTKWHTMVPQTLWAVSKQKIPYACVHTGKVSLENGSDQCLRQKSDGKRLLVWIQMKWHTTVCWTP